MNSAKLKAVVIKSLEDLCEKDVVLIDSAVKEECINHKLAQYIEKNTNDILPELTSISVDIEYNKYKEDPEKVMGQDPIRPDVLVHTRQSGNLNNYLAVEAKKDYSSKYDKEKIRFLISDENYNYSLGCLISYQPNREYLILQFWQSGSSEWEKYKYRKQPFKKIE